MSYSAAMTTGSTARGASALLFGLAATTLLACGGSPQQVTLRAGPMPDEGSFTGVWYSPQYGTMNILQTGRDVIGEYDNEQGIEGTFEGRADGDLLRFQWTQERDLVIGHPVVTRGRGYFRYSIDDNGDHRIDGEWGLDQRNAGHPWTAVRDRRNPEPTLRRNSQSQGGVESFDRPEGAPPVQEDDGEGDALDQDLEGL